MAVAANYREFLPRPPTRYNKGPMSFSVSTGQVNEAGGCIDPGSGTLKFVTEAASRQGSYRSQSGAGSRSRGKMEKQACGTCCSQREAWSDQFDRPLANSLSCIPSARIAPSRLHSIDPAKPTYKPLSPTTLHLFVSHFSNS